MGGRGKAGRKCHRYYNLIEMFLKNKNKSKKKKKTNLMNIHA